MPETKCKLTKMEIIRLREEGLTYDQIAEAAGVSRQRVQQVVNVYRPRKKSVDIEKIRFKGFYEFMRDNPTVSYAMLAKAMYNKPITNALSNTLLMTLTDGSTSGDKIRLTVGQVRRLTAFTGKTFEELFTLRDRWEV